MRRSISRIVQRRARDICEYCRMPHRFYRTDFQVDHIIAEQHGGSTDLDNLAWSCLHCNLHKGPNLTGIDPLTKKISRLFHPRRDNWSAHFRWRGPDLVGRSARGRATIAVLAMNDPRYIAVRKS